MSRVVGLLVTIFCGVSTCAHCASATAQDYPHKAIRIIVLNSPGSGSDIMARAIAAKISEATGQQTVVDNRAGAGGNIGLEIGARAAPDGYTLVMVTSQQPIVVGLYDKLNYDLIKDFAPVSLLGTTPLILVVHPSVPANSTADLIALAKARPGEINYGSPGSGSSGHLAGEVFKRMAGISLTHVPYKGSTPALTDTMAGQVQLTFFVAPVAMPVVRAGKLRALGATTLQRSPLAPELPTIAETVPGYEWSGWYGLVAPAGTPAAIIDKLNAIQINALKNTEFRERLLGMGTHPLGSTPQEYAAYLRAEVAKMRQAIKMSGARAD